MVFSEVNTETSDELTSAAFLLIAGSLERPDTILLVLPERSFTMLQSTLSFTVSKNHSKHNIEFVGIIFKFKFFQFDLRQVALALSRTRMVEK